MEEKKSSEIKRFEIGPGIKYALVWLAIITSYGAGWYTHSKVTQGELASASLTVLKDDIVEKQESRNRRDSNEIKLEIKLGGKIYDKECGDRKLGDFYK